MQRLKKLWKNPMLRRLVMWVVPVVIGWILSKFDKANPSTNTTKRRK